MSLLEKSVQSCSFRFHDGDMKEKRKIEFEECTHREECLDDAKRTANINSRRRIFSHGSSMERTKVDSNHMRLRQKNCPSFEFGRRVKVWLGFAGGR